MFLPLGLLLFSFLVTSVAIVPFINALYKLKFQRKVQKTTDSLGAKTKVFDQLHNWKQGTPVGGGGIIILLVALMYALIVPLIRLFGVDVTNVYPFRPEVTIVFVTFFGFGFLGIFDDILKFFPLGKYRYYGLTLKTKLAIQIVLATLISAGLYFWLGINFVNIPFFGILRLGWIFIPFSIFVIVAFTNAVNITDGLDGLASGVLMVCLFALWMLSASILDTTLTVFIALWIGALVAFLYFNVYPARLWMGDVGALSFGATLAVIGLLLGKVPALVIIGGIFVIEAATSLFQIMHKKFRHQKLFAVAPLHLWLQHRGWEEPKIVTRAWLAAIILALFGLWLAFV